MERDNQARADLLSIQSTLSEHRDDNDIAAIAAVKYKLSCVYWDLGLSSFSHSILRESAEDIRDAGQEHYGLFLWTVCQMAWVEFMCNSRESAQLFVTSLNAAIEKRQAPNPKLKESLFKLQAHINEQVREQQELTDRNLQANRLRIEYERQEIELEEEIEVRKQNRLMQMTNPLNKVRDDPSLWEAVEKAWQAFLCSRQSDLSEQWKHAPQSEIELELDSELAIWQLLLFSEFKAEARNHAGHPVRRKNPLAALVMAGATRAGMPEYLAREFGDAIQRPLVQPHLQIPSAPADIGTWRYLAFLDFLPEMDLDRIDDRGTVETPNIGNLPRQLDVTPKLDLYPWQVDALSLWVSHTNRGIVEAVTGSGKTRLAVEAMRPAVDSGLTVVVVVPGVELLRQWETELRSAYPHVQIAKLGDNFRGRPEPNSILISTIQSAVIHLPAAIDGFGDSLLVADEVHRYGSSSWGNKINQMNFTYRLGITATLERRDDGVERFLIPYFEQRVLQVGYERARTEGAIAPFSIAFIGCSFSDDERFAYDAAVDVMQELQGFLGRYTDISPIRDFGRFLLEVGRIAANRRFVHEQDVVARANSYLKNFQEKRRLMATADEKYEWLRALAPVCIESQGTIIFTESIEAAERAARVLSHEGFSTTAVHSELSRNERNIALRDFEDAAVGGISAPRVLDEGINVPEADFAVIVASSRTRRQLIQRSGRVLRNKSDGRQARIVVLYIEHSTEDPMLGEKDGFVDIIIPAASRCRVFPKESTADQVCQFLTERFVPTTLSANDVLTAV